MKKKLNICNNTQQPEHDLQQEEEVDLKQEQCDL